MAQLDCLPFEIIEYILSCDVVSFVDVCRISSVSQNFYAIGKSNKLWQKKYTKMWPELARLLCPLNTDWKNEFQLRYRYKLLVSEKLQDISRECYHQDNVSNESFFQIRDVCGDHPLAYNILIDELERIIHDSDRHLNLTHKYYGKRALRYIRHNQLEAVWKVFLAQPQENISLIEGACLISQWCQPTRIHCTKDVPNQLNSIVETVFDRLKQTSPRHPVIKHGLLPPCENLTKSLWTPSQCRTILNCINLVLFKELKFSSSNEFYCSESNFIDKVLLNGTASPITMGVIYHSIAVRFGISCIPVTFPGSCLLKWLEHPELNGEDAYTYVFEEGTFKSAKELSDFGYHNVFSVYEADSYLRVFIKMCWNLVEVGRRLDGVGDIVFCLCNALELLSILSPENMEHKLLLARVYMHLCINMTEVISLLQEVAAHDPMSTGIVGYMYQSALTTLETQKIRRQNQKRKLHLREGTTGVKYAVGMIMKHKKYCYRCVIYGWDHVCNASIDWIKQMGVYNLTYQDKQPFYHVLVNDGTSRYAAQENLELDDLNEPISHIEVGRYFESYHGNYYLFNKEKMREYPQDFDTVREMLNLSDAM